MFTSKDRRLLAGPYFMQFREEEKFIEVVSKNTKHQWLVFKNSSSSKYPVTIYHKHSSSDRYYHKHYETYCVRMAVESIKGHDDYVLNGGKQNV